MKIFTIAVSAIALLVTLAVIGCRITRSGGPAVGSVPNPVLAVSATRGLVRPMRQRLTLLGTTVALRHLMLRAPTAGRVLGLELRSGERVRRGEVVGRIINRAEEAAQASAEIIQTHDPTQSTALEHSVERYTSGTGVAVVAPEAGIVAQRLVSSGQIVNELDPLADLVDPASVYVEAQVQIDDLSAIEPGMDATVTSSLSLSAMYPARVVALSPSFSTGGTISLVRVAFIGRDKIWGGRCDVRGSRDDKVRPGGSRDTCRRSVPGRGERRLLRFHRGPRRPCSSRHSYCWHPRCGSRAVNLGCETGRAGHHVGRLCPLRRTASARASWGRFMNGRSSHSLALLGAMAIGALGILAARAIPSAVFPELVFPRAIILADAADLPPEQMMVAVTRPLEEAAYGVVGTLLVRSTTTRGSAEIDVFFASGSDANSSFQLLNAAVAEVRNSLPVETKLDSRLLTTGTFPIVGSES